MPEWRQWRRRCLYREGASVTSAKAGKAEFVTARRTLVLRVEARELAVGGADPGAVARIGRAARLLREGRLVAFPTETVYGLGADATDDAAVRAIFAAKGRPQDNPLIAHVADVDGLYRLAAALTPAAETLARRFWPGPLTLVVAARQGILAPSVTAGLRTVGVRFPDHPVAAALIREAGVPVAAPSANLSGKPSPTTAGHVLDDLDGRVDAVVDGGPTGVGVESTVLDVTGAAPVLLRPGGVTREQIEEVVGRRIGVAGELAGAEGDAAVGGVPRSPGMKYTHYKPDADVVIVEPQDWGDPESGTKIARKVAELVRRAAAERQAIAILAPSDNISFYQAEFAGAPLQPRRPNPDTGAAPAQDGRAEAKDGGFSLILYVLGHRAAPEAAASGLFAALRELDAAGAGLIVAEGFPEEGLGLALMNRLRKAAGYRIVRC